MTQFVAIDWERHASLIWAILVVLSGIFLRYVLVPVLRGLVFYLLRSEPGATQLTKLVSELFKDRIAQGEEYHARVARLEGSVKEQFTMISAELARAIERSTEQANRVTEAITRIETKFDDITVSQSEQINLITQKCDEVVKGQARLEGQFDTAKDILKQYDRRRSS